MSIYLPKQASIFEVGPRDGLQNEDADVPTNLKVRLIDSLSDTGLAHIQATSFVHPRHIPRLRDAAEVMKAIRRKPGIVYSVLVPNQTGMERAIEAAAEEIEIFVSASESHNMLNVNRTVAQSLEGLRPTCDMAKQHGIRIRASIPTSFGCSIEGSVPVQRVIDISKELLGMGAAEISYGDTVGMANPRQTYELFCQLREALPGIDLAAHFHDTRGTGLANALAALQAGITIFDSSIGGMGGCPGTPGAAGNVATEDLVYMFEEMGVSTGVDVARLIDCVRLAEEIVGRRLPGQLSKAGLCKT